MIQNATVEAEFRTSIGRAYYSCFLIARDQLFGVDRLRLTGRIYRLLSLSQGNSHEVVIKAVANHPSLPPAKGKRISEQLRQLKDNRIQADYTRDPQSPKMASVFTIHQVNDWPGLAHVSMILASNLIPDLRSIPTFP